MQNLSGKDSEKRTVQSMAPWFANHSTCFNATEPQSVSLFKFGNTSLASEQEECCYVKHSNSKTQDQDSSSTLSTSLSKCKVATAERRDSYTQHITSPPGCNGMYMNHLDGCTRSYIPCGNADYTIQLQYDYNQSMVYPQMVGITPAQVPLPLVLTENMPVYVNPKQYHGILRRRQIRARLEAQKKLVKARKPYLHESRHLHALKRARGSGGRFLNMKKVEQSKPSHTHGSSISRPQHGGNISNSDGHQSETGSWGASTPPGSDITSIFSGDGTFQQSEFRAEYPLHMSVAIKHGRRITCNRT